MVHIGGSRNNLPEGFSKGYQQQQLLSRTKSRRKIRINVRGKSYETYHSTLIQYPNTLLGSELQRRKYYDRRIQAYCFDVSPDAFEAILFFYQSRGIMAKPAFVKENEYTQALKLFGIIRTKENCVRAFTICQKLCKILNEPHNSRLGSYLAYFSFAIIILSVATFCAETEIHREKPVLYRLNTVLFTLDCIFASFFTVEYCLRLFSSPKPLKYVASFLGVIDLVSIVPFYIVLVFTFYFKRVTSWKATFIQILRLVQILRIIKLSRYISGFRILARSLLACKDQMFSLCACFVIGTILSSNLMFVFEHTIDESTMFDSILSSMWFSVISMTTVGYGDVFPVTSLGKICATITILIGTVLLFHLFLPIYLMYFSLFYAKAQQEITEKWEARKKQTDSKISRWKDYTRNSIIAEAEAQQITSTEATNKLTVRFRSPSRVFSPTSFLADNAVSPAVRRNSHKGSF